MIHREVIAHVDCWSCDCPACAADKAAAVRALSERLLQSFADNDNAELARSEAPTSRPPRAEVRHG